jgi:hypothetical protein
MKLILILRASLLPLSMAFPAGLGPDSSPHSLDADNSLDKGENIIESQETSFNTTIAETATTSNLEVRSAKVSTYNVSQIIKHSYTNPPSSSLHYAATPSLNPGATPTTVGRRP